MISDRYRASENKFLVPCAFLIVHPDRDAGSAGKLGFGLQHRPNSIDALSKALREV